MSYDIKLKELSHAHRQALLEAATEELRITMADARFDWDTHGRKAASIMHQITVHHKELAGVQRDEVNDEDG